MLLCLRPAHYIRCSFTYIMVRQETVGAIRLTSNSCSGYEDRPEFIRCVDGRHPKIREIWTFREDGVTPEVHLTARVNIGDFDGDYFATGFLTPIWRRNYYIWQELY